MLNEFEFFSHPRRAEILDSLDTEYQTMETDDLRKYSEFVSFRRNMQKMHHTLRKAGR